MRPPRARYRVGGLDPHVLGTAGRHRLPRSRDRSAIGRFRRSAGRPMLTPVTQASALFRKATIGARSPFSGPDSRRVLILLENGSAPFDRRVRQESLALRDAGYDVVVILPRGTDDDREPYELWEGVAIHRFSLRPAGSAAGYLREYASALWSLRRLIRRLAATYRFGIVQSCNPPDFLHVAALPLRRDGARLVFDHHDLSPELYESRFGRRGVPYRALLAAERLAFRSADIVITTNESYRR